MIQFENVLSISAIVTCAGCLVRLAYQYGATIQSLEDLLSRVSTLTDKLDSLSLYYGERLATHNEVMARLQERVEDLEKRYDRCEGLCRAGIRVSKREPSREV